MIKVGLTGSIGMGKSTVAQMFADAGAAVWDADAAVRRLYAPGGAGVAPVAAAFPDALVEGGIDRDRLAACVLGKPEALAALETLVHPLAAADRTQFMRDAENAGATIIVMDIPLLFETGAAGAFDAVVVVSADADTQAARVMARPGMTAAKFAAIRARQTPDADKRAGADYVIDTNRPLEATRARVREIVAALHARFQVS